MTSSLRPGVIVLLGAILVSGPIPASTTWQPVVGEGGFVPAGFGDPANTDATTMAVLREHLYVATTDTATGTQVWRTPDAVSWSLAAGGGFGQPDNISVSAAAVFKGLLYLATYNSTTPTDPDGSQVWRTADGLFWERVHVGWSTTTQQAASAAVYSAHLFVGAWEWVSQPQVWVTLDGTLWQLSSADFGANSMAVFGGLLYAGGDGCRIWRTSLIFSDGFGTAGCAAWSFAQP